MGIMVVFYETMVDVKYFHAPHVKVWECTDTTNYLYSSQIKYVKTVQWYIYSCRSKYITTGV